jgi:small GTP-binding protein
MAEEHRFKIVMIGDSGVGKTAVVSRMSHSAFLPNHVPTVGSQFVTIEFTVEEQHLIFEVWDTAGQEVYRSLVGFYARDAKGAFLVFDVTSQNSFASLPNWIKFIQSESPAVKVIIFGNKTDLSGHRRISANQAQEFASANQCAYVEGSAKTGMGVSDAFGKMGELLLAASGDFCFVPSPKAPVPAEPADRGGCC